MLERDKREIRFQSMFLRKKLGAQDTGPLDIFGLALTIQKLTLIYDTFSESISGLCVKGSDGIKVIAINSAMSKGRQNFSLAHELYHLYCENNDQGIIICPPNATSSLEQRANTFASYFLLPEFDLQSYAENNIPTGKNWGHDDLFFIERLYGISRSALLIRLKMEFQLPDDMIESLNKNVESDAKRLGYDVSLYKADCITKCYGHYRKQFDSLIKSGLISESRYSEINRQLENL